MSVLNYKNINDLFLCIKDDEYVVLRNFEELFKNDFLSMHPDIDFLCKDKKRLIYNLHALPRTSKDDGIHYKVIINNADVSIDIRDETDGYLDERWVYEILKNRVKIEKDIYIPNECDYQMSLLYHMLIQKEMISNDYLYKASAFLDCEKEEVLRIGLNKLEEYMFDKNYKYTYPSTPYTTFNISKINKRLLEKDLKKMINRKVYLFLYSIKTPKIA